MIGNDQEDCSLKILCDCYKKAYGIPENLYYCPFNALKEAERYLVRHCILHGKTPLVPSETMMWQ